MKSITIKKAIELINNRKLFLPPIQRNFVWEWWRINMYFDSLYNGYPLGTLIFWRMERKIANQYPLYHFIKEYWEKQIKQNEQATRNSFPEEIYGVIDGQQRLSSLYIGLTGTYHYKDRRIRKDDITAAYQHWKLYVNLMRIGISTLDKDEDEENEKDSAFDFWEQEFADNYTAGGVWYEVGKILDWENENEAEIVLTTIQQKVLSTKKKSLIPKFKQRRTEILNGLKTLYKRLNEDEVIHYFEFESKNFDEVAAVFRRVNSGGMPLKKHEILFSTITAHWKEGREKIDALIGDLDKYKLEVDRGFVLKCCLCLSDLPVKYRLESFHKKNIDKIEANWIGIYDSIIKLAEILTLIGFKNIKSLSQNALIPIAYYIYKNGDIKKVASLNNLKLYYVTAQVRGLFGSQSDAMLTKLRDAVKEMQNEKVFNFKSLQAIDLPNNKSFVMNREFIEKNILKERYGNPNAYYILTLLYPQFELKSKRYHIDHIHPKMRFTKSTLLGIGMEEKLASWKEKCHELPNLQLLAGPDNIGKKSKLLEDFLSEMPFKDRMNFMRDNILPSNDKHLLKLKNFDAFYNWRKKILMRKLMDLFSVT